MAISTYNGIKVPGATTDTINSGTSTVGGILIDNDKYLADHIKVLEDANGLSVSSSRSGLTTTVTVTCGDSTHSFTVNDGTSAVSPAIAVAALSTTLDGVARTGSTLTITDQNGTRSVQVLNGLNGTNGVTPTVTLGTKTNGSQTLTITNGTEVSTTTIVDGVDGVTPTVTLGTKTNGSQTLTITNGDNVSTTTILDGTDGFTPTITVGTKTNGSQTLTITNQSGSSTATICDGITGWTEDSLVDGSNTLTDGASLYNATACSGASLSVGASWSTGATARVGITFAASSTFSYPNSWKCVGDDCASGAFTFVQGSSYWLTIECKPDYTWMTVIKVPS